MKRFSSSRLALVSSAAALVLAACFNGTDNEIAAPTQKESSGLKVSNDFGGAVAGEIQVCVSAGSLSGPYSVSFTSPTNFVNNSPENTANSSTINDVLQTSPQAPINPGECKLLFTKLNQTWIDGFGFTQSFTTMTITNTNAAQGGGTFGYICFPGGGPSALCQTGSPVNPPVDGRAGASPTATSGANSQHGSTVTFTYTLGAPQFVVGDLAAGLQAAGVSFKGNKPKPGVNFWGSQWWKNNPMTLYKDNGWPSFKGYATTAGTCGQTWTSRVGNSPPPPATIGEYVDVIVTSNVWKDGPDIRGNIKQIVRVHQDGGYGPNPGHDGNGPVTEILCTAPLN
ncbi:MAG TPA: hypothetical protein VM053_06720 [Gemmatimonadaceae bacterium]|nr:hypothetical protein [Gemmatimonadaceae bacterium]